MLTLAPKVQALIERARDELLDIVTGLNTLGSVLLEYALQNQDIASQVLPFVPSHLRPTVSAILPGAWWLLVQYAKARAIRKAAGK